VGGGGGDAPVTGTGGDGDDGVAVKSVAALGGSVRDDIANMTAATTATTASPPPAPIATHRRSTRETTAE
jgi:hypothetical protein